MKCNSSLLVRRHAVWLTVISAATAPSFCQDNAPIPSEPAQQQALTLIKEVYGREWEAAKSLAQKQALAKKLLERANQSTDTANRYVLLKVARDVAAQAGDAELAFRAIDTMASRYDVDAYKLKGAALSQAAKSATLQKLRSTIAKLSLELIDQAVEKDDFVAAKYVGGLAVDAARKAKEYALVKQIVARNEEVEEIAKVYADIQEALATLKGNPVDPEANLEVGRYFCFVKGNWEHGLPVLALGVDGESKKLAVKELRGVSSAEDRAALGDGWWELASACEGTAQKRLQGRAEYWYRQALPGLTGLVKDRVEKRIAETTQNEIISRSTRTGAATTRSRKTEVTTSRRRMVGRPRILRYATREWEGSSSDYARYANLVFEVGMGKRNRNGYGESGIEIENVSKLTLAVQASAAFVGYSGDHANDYAGFVIDYHTKAGYTKRVALSFGFHNKKRWAAGPPWGTGRKFNELHSLGRRPMYSLDLEQFAPQGWDGRIWFTVMLQNSGTNTFVRAAIVSPKKWDTSKR